MGNDCLGNTSCWRLCRLMQTYRKIPLIADGSSRLVE